jgi:hypothetical protein
MNGLRSMLVCSVPSHKTLAYYESYPFHANYESVMLHSSGPRQASAKTVGLLKINIAMTNSLA